MRCYFCPRCGVRIFHAALLADGSMRAAVAFKGGAIEGLDWKGLKGKHIFTRSAVMELAEGWECYGTMPGAPAPAPVPVVERGKEEETKG